MANDKDDEKKLEAIEKTKPSQEHVMKTPGGASLRRDIANERVARDQERHSGNRADKHSNAEKESIANKEQVREGTRGRLGKEFGNQNGREHNR